MIVPMTWFGRENNQIFMRSSSGSFFRSQSNVDTSIYKQTMWPNEEGIVSILGMRLFVCVSSLKSCVPGPSPFVFFVRTGTYFILTARGVVVASPEWWRARAVCTTHREEGEKKEKA